MSDKKRYVREDGMVAVLYSPGFGAGLYTWAYPAYEGLVFDPELVKLVLEKKENWHEKFCAILKERYDDPYYGGVEDLEIEWMEPGTEFHIHEYDGNESIQYKDSEIWLEA